MAFAVNYFDCYNNEVDWVTFYNNAKADRKTINEGVIAAGKLRTLRATVEGLIGKSANGTDPGLYQNKTYTATDTFHYSATAETMSPADDGAITLKTPTEDTGGGLSTDNITYDAGDGTETSSTLYNMTADTMDQARFAHYGSDGVKWNVVTKPYGEGTPNNSLLKTTWDAYENAVKERKLLEAKIQICVNVASTASTTSVARITLADGETYVEVGEYKAWLEEQLATAQQNEATAKAAYDHGNQLSLKEKNPDLHTGHKTAAIMHSKPMKNIKMTFTIFQNTRFK